MDCVGPTCLHSQSHDEPVDGPFKGWFMLTVQNTGTAEWTDFHFELFQVTDPIPNASFLDTPGFEPSTTQAPFSYMISGGGKVLDFYFPDDAIGSGQFATFSVYTDNPDEADFFGVMWYPTPEPGTLLLFGLGALGLGLLGRRVRKP
jgi:hypothetical protein